MKSPEEVRAWYREWRKKKRQTDPRYRESRNKAATAWKAKNKERVAAYMKEYRARNKRVVAEQYAEWRKRNPERYKEHRQRHFQKHRYRLYAKTRKYQNRRLKATPRWANFEAMAELYRLAGKLTRSTGTKYQVDHIVPLQSKIVCGLHCEANLRVIPAIENNKKNNRTWPDMPDEARRTDCAH